ncbi:HLA class II histocompatibility antigen, DM beta chain-like isoform X2 [Lathamus discolor]|uniref:HLA class II histocompatibility antigen, DM beta chain-like isoform X2 n=1 Tax=Lathamus discolor TaxID=678569 RepID=UPI0032B87FDB
MTRIQRGLSLAASRMGHSPCPVTHGCGAGPRGGGESRRPSAGPRDAAAAAGAGAGGPGGSRLRGAALGLLHSGSQRLRPRLRAGLQRGPPGVLRARHPRPHRALHRGGAGGHRRGPGPVAEHEPGLEAEDEGEGARLQPPAAHSISGLGSAPPRARITSSSSGDSSVPVLLTCHVWGFYPPAVTVLWLHNGDLVPPGDKPPPLVPNGDLTYQTQLTLMAAPAHGDTFTCSVQHPALDQPLLVDWGHGLSPALLVKVVAATVVLLLGVGVFAIGLHRYRAPAPGYTPIEGDTRPIGSI